MIREVVYLDYLDALLQADKFRCESIIGKLQSQGVDIREIYIFIFQKALYKVGKLWEIREISVAEEHIATQITDYLVTKVFAALQNKDKTNKKAIISCMEKEFHYIGAKMVSNIFELNGWVSYFLGSNTPAKDLIKFIDEKQPDVIAISFSIYMNYSRFIKALNNIINHFPAQQIILGGQGLTGQLLEEFKMQYPSVKYFNSINDLDFYLQQPEVINN